MRKLSDRFVSLMFGLVLLMMFSSSGGSGCGSGTTRGASGTEPTGTATVSGVLTQPNGDPIPGALVYVEQEASAASFIFKSKKRLTDDEDETCEDVPSGVTAAASDCTSATGAYSFSIPDCEDVEFTEGTITVNFRLGALVGSFTSEISCSGESNDEGSTTVEDAVENLTIAVCSGQYDKMENVLARMGFAPSDTDGDGEADLDGYDGTQTEQFNFFRGHVETTPGEENDGYPNCCELLKGNTVAITDETGAAVTDSDGVALSRTLSDYDTVFINCGSGCESAGGGFTGQEIDDLLTWTVLRNDLTIKAVAETSGILNYVNDGGALYVTDLSYDFVEQIFPAKIDFKDGGNGSSAETLNEAQDGNPGLDDFEPLEADVEQQSLEDYLAAVAAGNTDCGTPSGTGSLNIDNTVNICDFLSGWAVIIGLELNSDATIWIRGLAEFNGSDVDTSQQSVVSGQTAVPLTVSFSSGDGSVLYSSYHTDNSTTLTADFLPQERVLQFLILQTFGAIE